MKTYLLLPVCGLLLSACASDDFVLAKGVKSLPSVTDEAARVHSESDLDACGGAGAMIGRAKAAIIPDLARIVAENGGTHYVVTSDHVSRDIETRSRGARFGNSYAGMSTTSETEAHVYRANAYRALGCLPKATN